MRQDINKLLCERERYGSKDHYRYYRHDKNFTSVRDFEDFSDLPYREGMKKRYHKNWFGKQFSENLNPLLGFLRKSVGRNWNKVYSEICSTFDKRSVINQHILIHLFEFVETKIVIGDDGRPKFFNQGWLNGGWRDIKEGFFDYYVDPRDGRLQFNKNKKNRKQINKERAEQKRLELAKTERKLDEFNSLKKENNIWFHHYNKPYQEEVSYFDWVAKVWKKRIETKMDSRKKQLNKRELKRYNLVNK